MEKKDCLNSKHLEVCTIMWNKKIVDIYNYGPLGIIIPKFRDKFREFLAENCKYYERKE